MNVLARNGNGDGDEHVRYRGGGEVGSHCSIECVGCRGPGDGGLLFGSLCTGLWNNMVQGFPA